MKMMMAVPRQEVLLPLLLLAIILKTASSWSHSFLRGSREAFLQNIIATTAALSVVSPIPDNGKQSNDNDITNNNNIKGTKLALMSLSEASNQRKWPMALWPDPILRRPADPVESALFGTVQLQRAGQLLQQTCRQEHAVGLAAQQCGVNARIVYLENQQQRHHTQTGEPLLMMNPRIVERSSEWETQVWREFCLVLPSDFRATVLRDAWIRVEYQNLQGQFARIQLRGEAARAAQHELDHDRGILITDHVSLEELPTYMVPVEQQGHADRMLLAYSRYIDE